MSSLAQSLLDRFKRDPQYKAWFKRWWEADFSISGRKRGLEHESNVQKSIFAGRVWPDGWTPPHDLKGNINSDFRPITQARTQHYGFNIIKNEPTGLYFEITDLRPISQSPNLSFCAFLSPFVMNPSKSSILISDAFFAGPVQIDGSNQSEIFASNSYFSESFSYNAHRNTKFVCRNSYCMGTFTVAGQPVNAELDYSIFIQSVNIVGSVSGLGIRAKSATLSARRTDISTEVSLEGSDVGSITISGAHSHINLSKITSDDISIDSECSELDLTYSKAELVSISGVFNNVKIDNVDISKLIALEKFTVHTLYGSGSSFGSITGSSCDIERIDMPGLRVAGEAVFSKCKFSESVSITDAIFSGVARFPRTAFPGSVNFSNTNFARGADFRVGSGGDMASLNANRQMGQADFSGCAFGPDDQEICANFDGREMYEAASFEQAIFVGVPMFYEARFHENTSFRGAKFQIVSPETSYLGALGALNWRPFLLTLARAIVTRSPDLAPKVTEHWADLQRPMKLRRAMENRRLSAYERAYNALRQRFEQVGNAKFERQFHNYELRARRRRIDADVSALEGFISWFYDVTSSYGQSITRPLAVLTAFFLIFSLFYFSMAGHNSMAGVAESVVFSARQIIKPFGVWGRDITLSADASGLVDSSYTSGWISSLLHTGLPDGVFRTTIVRLAATVQSLLSLVLLFLAGLATRRTFGVG